jgi:hypothetical protein
MGQGGHVMSLTWQNGCFGSILLELIILPWNKVSLFVHLLGMRGQRCQDHASMNAKVLVNPLVQIQWNDQRANAHAKSKAIEEWEQLQLDANCAP